MELREGLQLAASLFAVMATVTVLVIGSVIVVRRSATRAPQRPGIPEAIYPLPLSTQRIRIELAVVVLLLVVGSTFWALGRELPEIAVRLALAYHGIAAVVIFFLVRKLHGRAWRRRVWREGTRYVAEVTERTEMFSRFYFTDRPYPGSKARGRYRDSWRIELRVPERPDLTLRGPVSSELFYAVREGDPIAVKIDPEDARRWVPDVPPPKY